MPNKSERDQSPTDARWRRFPPVRCLLASLVALAAVSLSGGQDAKELARSFFHARLIKSPVLCPSGQRLAYVLQSKEHDWLWVHDTLTHASRAYEQTRGLRIREVAWMDDAQVVFEVWNTDTAFKSHYRLDTRRQIVTPLHPEAEGFSLAHPLPFQSRRALLTRTQPGGVTEIVKVEIGRASLGPAAPPLAMVERYLIDSYGKPRLARMQAGGWVAPNRAENAWEPVAPPPDHDLIDFIDAGSSLLATRRDEPSVSARVLAFPSFEARPTTISDPLYDVRPDLLVRDNRTYRVAGFRYQRDRPRYVWLDPQYEAWHEQLAARLPGSEIKLLGADPDGRRVAAFASADNEPGHLFIFLTGEEEIQSVRYSGPLLDHEALPRTMPFYFLNRANRRIHGYITLPHKPFKKPFALVVLARHGPERRSRWGYDAQKHFLCKLGYAVIEIDPRGTVGYGAEYGDHPFINELEYAVADTIDAVRWAIDHGFAHLNRVALFGQGFGGYVAAAALAEEPQLFRCAAMNAGIYDWNRYILARPDAYAFGDVDALALGYQDLSPVNRANRIVRPTLLLHAQRETAVSIDQSREMHRALRQMDWPTTLAITSWGPADDLSPEAQYDLHLRLARFLAEHVPTR